LENHVSTYEIDGKQYTVVTTRNITERKQAEEALRERQEEVETLNTRLRRSMRETHHRVKNNLQVISAMLDLQEMQHGENIPVSEIVRLRQHIRTLAMVHDLLTYQARDDDEVHDLSIKDAMERLLPMVQGMISGRQVLFDVEEARLPIRQSTTFAVLVNEMVSNAVKHGEGTIRVRFYISGEIAHLEVVDEGPGFDEGFDPRKSANTGLELIQSLAQWDLAGQSSFRNLETGGACASIEFPLVKADPSSGEW
jgi:two-component sensor histidine kinase